MRFFGWFTAFAVLVVAIIAGAIGYNLGLGVNIANSGVAVPVAYPGYGWGFGFGGIFGLIFFLIILFVIFGAIKRADRGGRSHGYGPGPMGRGWGPGPGGWKHGQDDAFERWHRQAHGEPEESPTSSPPQQS